MMHNNMLALVPFNIVAKGNDGSSDTNRPKRNTKAIGIVSELVAMERFSRAGFFLYVSFGDAAPADLLLVDRNARMFRIQVKTGRLRNGAVLFSCVSNHGHRKMPPTSYVGRIDAFAVYCPDNDELYLIPIGAPAATSSVGSLRIIPPSNNLSKMIRWAKDYRFDINNPAALLHGTITGAAGED